MRIMIRLFIVSILLLFPTMPGFAQEGTPTPGEGMLVQGILLNQTTGEPAPDGIELMLHAWDENGNSSGMVHGLSGPEGVFTFEDVIVEDGLVYAVMAVYQEVAYFSGTFVPDKDSGLPEIVVPIYESTTDTSDITIDLLHLVIGAGQGGLMVAEFYALSNQGDRTVVNSSTLEQGDEDTLVFTLPANAANVSFSSSPPERFRVIPGGFVDNNGINPGAGTSQVVVTYALPYEDGLSLTRPMPFDTGEIKVFLPHQIGLQVEVTEGIDEGVKTLGSEAETYEVYALGPLQQGDPVELVVTGTLPNLSPLAGEETTSTNNKVGAGPGLVWGTSILGVVLIITGLWWWRKGEGPDSQEDLEWDEFTEES